MSYQELCVGVNESICTAIGDAAVHTLGGAEPPGDVVVLPRSTRPAQMPSWADSSQCWQVNLPTNQTTLACVIVAKGTDGEFRSVQDQPTHPAGCQGS